MRQKSLFLRQIATGREHAIPGTIQKWRARAEHGARRKVNGLHTCARVNTKPRLISTTLSQIPQQNEKSFHPWDGMNKGHSTRSPNGLMPPIYYGLAASTYQAYTTTFTFLKPRGSPMGHTAMGHTCTTHGPPLENHHYRWATHRPVL